MCSPNRANLCASISLYLCLVLVLYNLTMLICCCNVHQILVHHLISTRQLYLIINILTFLWPSVIFSGTNKRKNPWCQISRVKLLEFILDQRKMWSDVPSINWIILIQICSVIFCMFLALLDCVNRSNAVERASAAVHRSRHLLLKMRFPWKSRENYIQIWKDNCPQHLQIMFGFQLALIFFFFSFLVTWNDPLEVKILNCHSSDCNSFHSFSSKFLYMFPHKSY